MDDSLHQLQNQLDAISNRLDAPVDKQKPKPGELTKLLRQIYRLRYNLLTNRIETNGEPINGNHRACLHDPENRWRTEQVLPADGPAH